MYEGSRQRYIFEHRDQSGRLVSIYKQALYETQPLQSPDQTNGISLCNNVIFFLTVAYFFTKFVKAHGNCSSCPFLNPATVMVM